MVTFISSAPVVASGEDSTCADRDSRSKPACYSAASSRITTNSDSGTCPAAAKSITQCKIGSTEVKLGFVDIAFSAAHMHTLAIIHWGYLALFVTVVGAVAFAPVVKALFRNARTIANTSSDKFRLNNTHIWTEAYHTDGGGSYQSMRLNDGNFV